LWLLAVIQRFPVSLGTAGSIFQMGQSGLPLESCSVKYTMPSLGSTAGPSQYCGTFLTHFIWVPGARMESGSVRVGGAKLWAKAETGKAKARTRQRRKRGSDMMNLPDPLRWPTGPSAYRSLEYNAAEGVSERPIRRMPQA